MKGSISYREEQGRRQGRLQILVRIQDAEGRVTRTLRPATYLLRPVAEPGEAHTESEASFRLTTAEPEAW